MPDKLQVYGLIEDEMRKIEFVADEHGVATYVGGELYDVAVKNCYQLAKQLGSVFYAKCDKSAVTHVLYHERFNVIPWLEEHWVEEEEPQKPRMEERQRDVMERRIRAKVEKLRSNGDDGHFFVSPWIWVEDDGSKKFDVTIGDNKLYLVVWSAIVKSGMDTTILEAACDAAAEILKACRPQCRRVENHKMFPISVYRAAGRSHKNTWSVDAMLDPEFKDRYWLK